MCIKGCIPGEKGEGHRGQQLKRKTLLLWGIREYEIAKDIWNGLSLYKVPLQMTSFRDNRHQHRCRVVGSVRGNCVGWSIKSHIIDFPQVVHKEVCISFLPVSIAMNSLPPQS